MPHPATYRERLGAIALRRWPPLPDDVAELAKLYSAEVGHSLPVATLHERIKFDLVQARQTKRLKR